MTLLRTYTPASHREFNNRPDSLSRLFNRFFEEEGTDQRQYFAIPPANIREQEKDYIIELAVPGYTKENFSIELDENLLTISLNEEGQKEDKEDKEHYIMKEFGFEGFKRSFRLSDKVEKEQIAAKYENGLLQVTIPKKKEMMNRSIEIS